jgi:capsular polysaccharide biosynthesis protein
MEEKWAELTEPKESVVMEDKWAGPTEPKESVVPSRVGLRALSRRGWIVPMVTLAVTAVAWAVAANIEPTYRAETVAQVPAGAGPEGPGDATSANALAETYAALVPNDDAVARHAARATGIPFANVFEHISVFNDKDTAILHLGFEADSEQRAIAGARALGEAVGAGSPVGRRPSGDSASNARAARAGDAPRTNAVAPGSLQATRSAARAVDESTFKPGTAIPVGLMVGLMLGLMLAIAWERADPRADDAATIRAEFGCPAVQLDDLSSGALTTLLERWRSDGLAAKSRTARGNGGELARTPLRVALIPTHPKVQADAENVAERLAEAGRREGVGVEVVSAMDLDDPRYAEGVPLALMPAGPPGRPAGVDRATEQADIVVVIARTGQAMSVLREAWSMLDALDLPRDFVVLTASSPGARTSSANGWT